MDRRIIYPGSIPLDADQLLQGQWTKEALGRVLDTVYGEQVSSAIGFAITLSGSALSFGVGIGVVNAWGVVDYTAVGGQGGGVAASSVPVTNQYINDTPQTVSGLSSGTTYTIYAVCQETDTDETVLPFYNATTPSQTQAGPNNTGSNLPTRRNANVTIVAATAAPSAPATGVVVPLYTLVIPSGATAASAGTLTSLQPFYMTIPELQAAVKTLLAETTNYLPAGSPQGASQQTYFQPTPSSTTGWTNQLTYTLIVPHDGYIHAITHANCSNTQPSSCQLTLQINGSSYNTSTANNPGTVASDTTVSTMSLSGVMHVKKGDSIEIVSYYGAPQSANTFAEVGQTLSYMYHPSLNN
ncbi:hypothetical protein [Tanticharoenia sakaeratensis]|uniref:Uncharacterized protein n=1 Tax=Tanticharoenia sakaeratensis NBRC 103193 TaxID=1231623 RepID=A0A0D6MNN7_9PROT|nr:hypothetical protein [Tanticharoenia sakaeratensis]GAN55279.1 hypothetical protein Tasa_041_074 [Tanticharoenia sakaeratensis NBRC 103193]GBQ23433.1 hypothetical protein AA103193_2416 [Tanticharoenia sakaeratensis NBRC 103193]